MLIRLQSKKSEPILSYNGKLLASSVNAKKEACAWVDRHKAQLDHIKNVIVLGVGCGYHLVELQAFCPAINIYAVDTVQVLIDFAREQHPIELANVKLICAKCEADINNSSLLSKAVADFYTVLSFSPARVPNEILYQECQDFLLARNKRGLQFVLRNRAEMQQQFDLTKVSVKLENLSATPENFKTLTASPTALLSIKDLMGCLTPNSELRTGLLFKTLRELVV